jgi:hypothetical protein
MSIPRRIREWTDIIEGLGPKVVGVQQNKHIKFVLDNGHSFILAKTPTDHRNDANALRELKAAIGWKRPEKAPVKPKKPKAAPNLPDKRKRPPATIWQLPERQPQANRNPFARARLGLDGPKTEPVTVRLGRPILRLPKAPTQS